MKKLITVISLAVTAAILFGCGRDKYSKNVSCEEILDAYEVQAANTPEYESFGSEYINAYFDTSLFEDCDIRYSLPGDDVNEVGVFRSGSKKDARKLYNSVCEYLDELKKDKRAFVESYAPLEAQKLDRATVKRFGSYVVYAILSDSEQENFFEAVKNRISS